MAIVACTLFEKHYHYGVAALVNSLYYHKYKGPVYVGYRGELPAWCSNRKPANLLSWQGASTLEIDKNVRIHFLPIDTDTHFVFYKPIFMMKLFERFEAEGVVYFDPDIVIKCKWDFFKTWMSHGVALVHEIVDRPDSHPIRREWKKVIDIIGRQTTRTINSYINSGFCGVLKQDLEFLTIWNDVINTGVRDFNLKPKQWGQTYDKTYLFWNADQDALNVAAMCCNCSISEVGPEGMDIIPGGNFMSHALDKPKPWKKKYIRSVLIKGAGPRLADKKFFAYVKGPVKPYGNFSYKFKVIKLYIAAFIARFYRRS